MSNRRNMIRRPLWIMALVCSVLAACSVDDLIEIEIVEEIEQDHWAQNGQKTCKYRYKILNNTAEPIIRLSATLVWRDRYGRDIESTIILNSELPPDQATSRGQTPVMQGSCDQLVFKGIQSVLRCQVGGIDSDACRAKVRTRFNLHKGLLDTDSGEIP